MKMNKKKAPVLKTILIDLAVIAAIYFSFTYFFELGRVKLVIPFHRVLALLDRNAE